MKSTTSLKTLKEYIQIAEDNKIGIGHFNFATHDMMQAIIEATQEVSEENDNPFPDNKIPVVLGLSEGERDWYGMMEAVTLTRMYREAHDWPVFINADHTYSVERTKEAIDMGFDMVIYDGVKGDHATNIKSTKEVVDYKNEVNPDCLVEAELGFIGSGSNVKDEIPEGVSIESMTKPEEAKVFIDETGIDLIAPSVGNIHGMIKSGNPELDHERVAQVRQIGGKPMVLHGGSGVSDEDFQKSISAGISMIHISTELRRAYRKALEESLKESEKIAPYKYLPKAKDAVKAVVKARIELFLNQ